MGTSPGSTSVATAIPSRSPAHRFENDWIVAGLIFAAALILYLLTMSPSVVEGDGGELQMLSYRLGVTHPTGYPLMLMLGWVLGHVPIGPDFAWRVSLMGAIASALSMALLYLTARELRASRMTAAAAAMLLASAQRIWMHATAAEVYALADFFLLLGLWLLLRWRRGVTPLWLVTLAFGFGLTHHINIRLVGPAALVFVFLVQPDILRHPRTWLPSLATLLLPLLLYAYTPLRAGYYLARPELAGTILGVRKVIAAGFVSPHYFAGGVLSHALALDYSSGFLHSDSSLLGLEALPLYWNLLRLQVPWIVVPFALLGVIVLLRRDPKASALLLLTYGFTLLAALRFLASVGEDGDHFIPPYLLMGIWFAVGADAVIAWSQARLRWSRYVLAVLLWALVLANLWIQYPRALDRRQVTLRADSEALLSQPLPDGAVLAGAWSTITPLRYLQRVDGVRPDLWIMQADAIGFRKLIERALEDQQPLYFLRSTDAGVRTLPVPVWDSNAVTHPDTRVLNDAMTWRGYDLAATAARPGDTLPITLYWQATAPQTADWSVFIHMLDENGEKVAQLDQTPLAAFYPPSSWQPGLLLADQYELALPSDLPPGTYHLIFGAYSGDDRFDWADGRSEQPLAEIMVVP
ncbi:MAG: DUF2723 domain-containing protein [Caldilineae bacterium]|nr:DUF2723 domain-containing protein [Caldilineae bacterium]